MIRASNKPKTHVYNGKKKIHNNYNDNWVTKDIVNKVMAELKPKRCQGYDRIPLVFYLDGKDQLVNVITKLMNKIMLTGIIPEQWKIAKVIPLKKKGNSSDVENFRPISNLSSVTKIFERLILIRIGFIEKQEQIELTGNHQFGFKQGLSTESACLEIQSRIANKCDINEFVAMATIDMSSAFDVVDIKLLLTRLKIMGFPSDLLLVLEHWLSNRLFYCEVDSSVSIMIALEAGTVQGSILGPILYALFTAPLEDLVDQIITYADDNFQIGSRLTEK